MYRIFLCILFSWSTDVILDTWRLLGYNTHITQKKGWDYLLCSVELKKLEWLPSARNAALVRRINAFLASPLFIFTVGALTVLANVFAVELFIYTAFIICGIYISIWGDDFLPVMPMVVCSYIAPSFVNNPGRFKGSIFYLQNSGEYDLDRHLECLRGVHLKSLVCHLIKKELIAPAY